MVLSAPKIVPISARSNYHVTRLCDVKLCVKSKSNMESKAKYRKGGRYCVAGGPNNQSCKNSSYTEGITMHQFPIDQIIRRKWVKFVQRHRKDFAEPINKYAVLCSAHFEESCYTRRMNLEGAENLKLNRLLIRGSIPSRDAVVPASPAKLTKRAKRQVSTKERYNP